MNCPERWKDIVYKKSMSVRNKLPKIPQFSDKTAVILEFRNDMFLLHVLRIFIYHLAPKGFAFHVYYGLDNSMLVETFIKPLGVQIHKLKNHNITPMDYTRFLKSKEFWEMMPSETILIFELDTFIRHGNIKPFLQYDYVGAPWNPEICPWSFSKKHVGNGGLSIRKRSAMLRCIASKRDSNLSDDRYFGEVCEDLLDLPETDVARSFSVETWFHEAPLGYHKPWLWLSEDDMNKVYESMLSSS